MDRFEMRSAQHSFQDVTSAFSARMFRMAVCAYVLVAMAACHREPQPVWTSALVDDLVVQFEDPPASESYAFHRDGLVSATIATKDGMVFAPEFGWRIVDGRLEIGEGDNKEEWVLVSRSARTLVVRRRGTITTFDVLDEHRESTSVHND
jgi:hypothetical protein